jgi:hypothetical protein
MTPESLTSRRHHERSWSLGDDVYIVAYWRMTFGVTPRIVITMRMGARSGDQELKIMEMHDQPRGLRTQILSSTRETRKNQWTIDLVGVRPSDPDLLKRMLKNEDPTEMPFFGIVHACPEQWREVIEHWEMMRINSGLDVLRQETHQVNDS